MSAPFETLAPPPDQNRETFYLVIYYLTIVLFGISVICASIVLVTFLLFKRIRTFPIKLIMFLCCTIIVAHTCFILAFIVNDIDWLCTVVGALLHTSLLANFLWCFCIAFNFYLMIVKRNTSKSNEKWYHLISWGFPAIAAIVVSALKAYGLTSRDGSCYVRGTVILFVTFFLPGLIIFSANCVLFFFVASEIHVTLQQAPSEERSKKTREFRVLMSIFVVVGLTWILGFANSLLSEFPIIGDIMLVLTTLITPLQGFFIFVAYCINNKVQRQWQSLFSKIPGCGCCKPSETERSSYRSSSRPRTISGQRSREYSTSNTSMQSSNDSGAPHLPLSSSEI